AVGRTPHEHNGIGAPTAEAQRTDRILPRPSSRANSRGGTSTASTPAMVNPTSKKREASRRMDHASAATWSRNAVMRDSDAEGEGRRPADWPASGIANGSPA